MLSWKNNTSKNIRNKYILMDFQLFLVKVFYSDEVLTYILITNCIIVLCFIFLIKYYSLLY